MQVTVTTSGAVVLTADTGKLIYSLENPEIVGTRVILGRGDNEANWAEQEQPIKEE